MRSGWRRDRSKPVTSDPEVRFGLAAALILAIAIISVTTVTWAFLMRENLAEEQEQTWNPAQTDGRELLTAVVDQETGQRAFVLTNDVAFLEPYTLGRAESERLLAELEALLAGEPRLTTSIGETRRSLQRWQEIAESEIAMATSDPDAARQAVAEGTGRQQIDGFREAHRALLAEIDRQAVIVENRRERSVDIIQLTVLVAAVVLVGVALLALRQARRWTRQRDEHLVVEKDLRVEKENANRRLLESASLFRGVIDTSAIGIAVFDTERRFVDINESLAERNGRPRADHLGRTPEEVFDEPIGRAMGEMVDSALAGETLPEVPVTGLDPASGVDTRLLVSYFPIRHPDGRVFAVGCNVVDVTDLTSANESLQRTRSRLRTIIGKLQASLLPARLPDMDGFRFAVEYRSAADDTDIGGDFYDVNATVGGGMAVTIGDVCGHDIEAATSVAIVRHTIAAASQHIADPSEVLRWAHDSLLARVDGHRYVTVAHAHFAMVDGSGARCTLVLGGHPPPLLIRADGTPVREVGEPGTLLGTTCPLRSTAVEIDLLPGDQLVFYTDGMFENPDPRLDPDQLMTMLEGCRRDRPDHLLDDLMDRYDSLTARVNLDDVAVLVVQAE